MERGSGDLGGLKKNCELTTCVMGQLRVGMRLLLAGWKLQFRRHSN